MATKRGPGAGASVSDFLEGKAGAGDIGADELKRSIFDAKKAIDGLPDSISKLGEQFGELIDPLKETEDTIGDYNKAMSLAAKQGRLSTKAATASQARVTEAMDELAELTDKESKGKFATAKEQKKYQKRIKELNKVLKIETDLAVKANKGLKGRLATAARGARNSARLDLPVSGQGARRFNTGDSRVVKKGAKAADFVKEKIFGGGGQLSGAAGMLGSTPWGAVASAAIAGIGAAMDKQKEAIVMSQQYMLNFGSVAPATPAAPVAAPGVGLPQDAPAPPSPSPEQKGVQGTIDAMTLGLKDAEQKGVQGTIDAMTLGLKDARNAALDFGGEADASAASFARIVVETGTAAEAVSSSFRDLERTRMILGITIDEAASYVISRSRESGMTAGEAIAELTQVAHDAKGIQKTMGKGFKMSMQDYYKALEDVRGSTNSLRASQTGLSKALSTSMKAAKGLGFSTQQAMKGATELTKALAGGDQGFATVNVARDLALATADAEKNVARIQAEMANSGESAALKKELDAAQGDLAGVVRIQKGLANGQMAPDMAAKFLQEAGGTTQESVLAARLADLVSAPNAEIRQARMGSEISYETNSMLDAMAAEVKAVQAREGISAEEAMQRVTTASVKTDPALKALADDVGARQKGPQELMQQTLNELLAEFTTVISPLLKGIADTLKLISDMVKAVSEFGVGGAAKKARDSLMETLSLATQGDDEVARAQQESQLAGKANKLLGGGAMPIEEALDELRKKSKLSDLVTSAADRDMLVKESYVKPEEAAAMAVAQEARVAARAADRAKAAAPKAPAGVAKATADGKTVIDLTSVLKQGANIHNTKVVDTTSRQ